MPVVRWHTPRHANCTWSIHIRASVGWDARLETWSSSENSKPIALPGHGIPITRFPGAPTAKPGFALLSRAARGCPRLFFPKPGWGRLGWTILCWWSMVWCDQAHGEWGWSKKLPTYTGTNWEWRNQHWWKVQALTFLLPTGFLQEVCCCFFFYYLPHPFSILFILLLVFNFSFLVSCLVLGSPVSLLVTFTPCPLEASGVNGHSVLPAWEFMGRVSLASLCCISGEMNLNRTFAWGSWECHGQKRLWLLGKCCQGQNWGETGFRQHDWISVASFV